MTHNETGDCRHRWNLLCDGLHPHSSLKRSYLPWALLRRHASWSKGGTEPTESAHHAHLREG